MGTNYYGKRIMKAQDWDLTETALKQWDLEAIIEHLKKFQPHHLGKASGGWRFLFNHNNWQYYSSIAELLANLDEYEIVDEYKVPVSAEEFRKLVQDMQKKPTFRAMMSRRSNNPYGWPYEDYYVESGEFTCSTSTEFC